MKNELSEEAKQARRQYYRAWNSKHRDEVRKYNREYMKAWRQKNPEMLCLILRIFTQWLLFCVYPKLNLSSIFI